MLGSGPRLMAPSVTFAARITSRDTNFHPTSLYLLESLTTGLSRSGDQTGFGLNSGKLPSLDTLNQLPLAVSGPGLLGRPHSQCLSSISYIFIRGHLQSTAEDTALACTMWYMQSRSGSAHTQAFILLSYSAGLSLHTAHSPPQLDR